MSTTIVRYHYSCRVHGALGSSAVRSGAAPADRRCPDCRETAEIWVGLRVPEPGVAALPADDGDVRRAG